MIATDSAATVRSPLAAYGCAVLSIVLATGLRWLMDPVLGDHLPFVTYFVAVMFTAWYAGWGPSLVAMGLGYLAATYFFVPPRGSFAATGIDNQIGIVLYFFVGIVSALLSESQRRAQRRAEANAQQVSNKQQVLEQEIAQHTRTEEALHESESRYRALIETLPQLVWTCQPDGRCDYLSRQWVEYTGVTAERHLGYGWTEQVHPDDRQHVQDVWAGAVRDGNLFDVEFRIRRADGQYRWFKTRAVPLRDPSGRIIKWFGSNTDIDELRRVEAEIRKLAEELESRVRERTAALSDANAALRAEIDARKRLEEQQTRLVAILESTTDFVAIADPDGRIQYLNRAGRKLIGLEEEADVGGLRIADKEQPLWPADVLQEGLAAAAREGRWSGETVLPTRDGREISMSQVVLAHKDTKGAVTFFSTIARDITERKRAEQQVRQAKERFQSLVETVGDWIWEIDQKGRYTYVSPRIKDLLGYEPADLFGKTPFELMPPDEAERVVATFEAFLSARAPFAGIQNTNLHKDGRRIVLETSGVPVFDGNGQFLGYRGVDRDITERKQAEEALVQSREMLRRIIDNIPQHVFWKDLNLNYLGCNELFARGAGVDGPDAIVGKTDFDLSWRDKAEMYRADDRSVMESKTPKLNFEEPLPRPDGSVWIIHTNKVPLVDQEGTVFGVLGIFEDITARKDMEARTSRLERLAAMGQLLSGIAHELKNPLFILTGYLQIGQEKLAQRQYETLSEEWKKIQEVAKRLEGITERFLRLALPVAGQQQRCSVPDILQSTLDLARNELAQNRIVVRADYAPDLPDTWLDAGQVREVFLNLVMNAIQAMAEAHGKGTLTVKAELSAVGDQPSAPMEQWIEVRIQDDGPGIPPELRTKIFEPFFTTKPPGKGTGLGLWVVRSNLMILRGTVRVETETGKGTTFIVQLPVMAEPSPSVDPQAPGAGRG